MTEVLDRLGTALADRYALEEETGHGGMARVFSARDLRHDRRVAVKVFDAGHASEAERARFLREIRLSAQLQHPHILPLFDSGETNGLFWFVMPFIDGESLRERLEREGQLPVSEALRLACEVADGLAFAHARGVVHRDVKPENILLSDGHALVADFGIARALSSTMGERITETGMSLGTPAYMSPEQASGDPNVDPRSDVYSAGIVLYEMLVGEPPFTGPNPQVVMSRRFTKPAPSPSDTRRTVPVEVDEIVSRALAQAPADRFPSAVELVQSLRALTSTSDHLVQRRRYGWSRRRMVAAAALPLLLVVALVVREFRLVGPALQPGLVAVLPFQQRADTAEIALSGRLSELLLREAMARWEGLQVVDELRTSDARSREGETAASLQGSLSLARELGAGLMAWGEVWRLGEMLHVRGTLYETRRGDVVRQHTVRIMPDLSDAGERFAELADSLLVGRPQASGASGGAGGTRSLTAWRAYERGHLALEAWDLVEARDAFLEAAREDPSYPHAHLALAHTTLWSGNPAADARGPASRALAVREKLGTREVALAEALLALAAGQYDEACRGYGDVVAIDSFSFAGWFGLGECHRADRLVVRDPASPSGWRFRASAELGTQAYARALEIIPSSHQVFAGLAYDRLADLLYTGPSTFLVGHTVGPDTSWFGAFQSLHADTLALIPYPFDEVVARAADFAASSRQAADRNRRRLVQVTRSWVSAFPASPTAHEALARALESAGRITGREPNSSALAAIARARELTAGRGDDYRLAILNVRLQVKGGEYAAARMLADSVLSRSERENARDSSLAALSALVGRMRNVPDLLSDGKVRRVVYSPRGQQITLPPPVAEEAGKLLAYAAAGVHADSIDALVARVRALSDALMTPEHREFVARELLAVPQMLAYPFTGTFMLQDGAGDEHALLSVQRALARGDTAEVRARLAREKQGRIGLHLSDLWIDRSYAEAWLLAAVGDTVGAERLLEQALAGIAESGTLLYDYPHLPAAMVRAFGLLAELAAGRGDSGAAARWASVVVQLWRDADPALQPFVQRMARLAN